IPVPEPKPGELDFRPLLMAGEKFTKKFPFSIPWDLARQLSVFDVTPKAPKITIDYSFSIGGKTMHPNWSLSLEWLDPLAAWIRWILTIAVDIAFILLLRRLMPE
ncbi:TPA: hypothetical protein RY089_001817, partial [Campylobacter jejuni]|nr:hypothetical protein [Campylobacter jejuni]